jgi:tetratricopeptide (TPR) repeat protein
MNNFGFALSKSDRLGQAEFVLNLVLRNKPDRATAWENYAHILVLKGEHELAIGAYANALRFSKNRNFTINFLKKQLETETNDYIRLAISKALEKSAQIAEWQECNLPINLEDTEEKVQEVFNFAAKTDTFNRNQKSYRHMNLSNIGINLFFVDRKIDSITLTSPFCGNINGVNIGDDLATLKIKMGDPDEPPSSWGRRTYSYGIKQNTIFNFSVDNYNVIESITIHANRS